MKIKKTLKKKSLNDQDQDRIHEDVDGADQVIVEDPEVLLVEELLEALRRDEENLLHQYRKKFV